MEKNAIIRYIIDHGARKGHAIRKKFIDVAALCKL